MWIGALLSSSAANFGRLLIVGLLPNAILLAFVWLLLKIHAFTSQDPLTFSALSQTNFKTDSGGLLLFVLLVLLVTVVLQPFQIRMVQLLEGYWEGSRVGRLPHRLAVVFHAWRRDRLWEAMEAEVEPPPDATLCQRHARDQCREQRQARRKQAAAERATAKLRLYPPPETIVMPTMLGNALRRNESIAGERYGLKTIHTWPRLYPYLSDRLASEYNAQVDSIDAAANLALTFTLMAATGIIAFADDRWLLIVPAILLLFAFGAYRAAIAATIGHASALTAAYDLHRFDMIKALHLELPRTPELEMARNEKLSAFFKDTDEDVNPSPAQELLGQFTYLHDLDK